MSLHYNNTTDSSTSAYQSTLQSTIMTTITVAVTTASNNTTNGSNVMPPTPQLPIPCPGDTELERIIKIVAYSIGLVVSLIGNMLIAAVVLSNKKMKRPTNYFILNMALSDLVVPFMIISRQFIFLDGQRKHPYIWLVDGTFGVILCKGVYFLQDVTTAVSIFSLILITVDRFIAVVYPMKHYVMSNTISKISILATWLIAMGLHAIYLYSYETINFQGNLLCYQNWKKIASENVEEFKRQYFIALFSILVIIPLGFMIIAYSIIIISLKRQSAPLGDSFSDQQKRQRAERESKVLRMAVAIIVSFLLLWAPYNVYIFLQLFVNDPNKRAPCNSRHFQFAGFYCAYLNAAVNPCICFIFSQNFRQGLKQLLARIGIVRAQNIRQQVTTQISMTMQNTAYEGDN